MNHEEEAVIYLQEPVDQVEYVASVLSRAYKTEARTWYDLAKAAIAAVEKYNAVSRKVD